MQVLEILFKKGSIELIKFIIPLYRYQADLIAGRDHRLRLLRGPRHGAGGQQERGEEAIQSHRQVPTVQEGNHGGDTGGFDHKRFEFESN